ncbi:hypothetical protein [Clostridium sp. OS1-26]|uniref:hypothetical protein n=1 Tax=Clostridium sp. OS1-26 TaxID=3070681 RepID=UPI0027E03D6F|nr:hypothetical protein [Clostridium sp. OS1-26]WML34420.1 hypothetical protein RCG18_24565 [Clostridium sp. OS1-26]
MSNNCTNKPDNVKIEPLEKMSQCKDKIKTVEEYLKAIDSVYKKFWGETQSADTLKYSPKIWYRGVKAQDYVMLPSISRRGLNVDYETIFLSKFKSKAIPYLGQLPSYPFSEELSSYWD